uniref:DoxX family membrane protein n=1 Tax=Vaginimicrobium propionicum TaxID=1871034 RepID=UPI000970972F|nr:DoxX family membrane protein [Vaginimicrobium propionicum]
MALVHFIGRSLFASYFIKDGVSLITKPDDAAEALAATTDRVVPAAQSVLPDGIAAHLPEEPRTWARIFGVTQVVAGLMYAIGFGRRTGAWLLAATSVPRVIAASKNDDNRDLTTALSLLGASIVGAKDTKGAPSISWRIEDARKNAAKKIEKARS